MWEFGFIAWISVCRIEPCANNNCWMKTQKCFHFFFINWVEFKPLLIFEFWHWISIKCCRHPYFHMKLKFLLICRWFRMRQNELRHEIVSHTQKNGKRTIVCRISMTITYFKKDKNDKQTKLKSNIFLSYFGKCL